MIARRAALLGGAALAAGSVTWAWRQRPQRFDFRPLTTPPGFRELPRGQVTPGAAVFAGIGGTAPADSALASSPCPVLFRAPGPGVPVASFTDVACPYCRVLAPILTDMAKTGAIALTWHELPLLGPASVAAARATIAAEAQGAGDAFRARLMRTSFVPTDSYLRSLAGSLDLDANRLIADAASPATNRRLAETRALARLFAIPGTPALVAGRTLVVGAISRPRLDALIALEARTAKFPCA